VGVSAQAVKNEVVKKLKIKGKRQKKDFEKDVTRIRANMQPASRGLRYSDELSAVAEEGVVRCILLDPILLKTAVDMGFTKDEFTSEFLAKVYGIVQRRIFEERDVSEKLVLTELESDEAAQLTVILQKPEALSHGDKIVSEYIEKIRAEKLKKQAPDEGILLEIKRLKQTTEDRDGYKHS